MSILIDYAIQLTAPIYRLCQSTDFANPTDCGNLPAASILPTVPSLLTLRQFTDYANLTDCVNSTDCVNPTVLLRQFYWIDANCPKLTFYVSVFYVNLPIASCVASKPTECVNPTDCAIPTDYANSTVCITAPNLQSAPIYQLLQ